MYYLAVLFHLTLSVRGTSLDARIRRLFTSDSDVQSLSALK